MEHFKKLLEKRAGSQKPMNDLELGAKKRAVQEMRKMAADEMAIPLKGLKKVTVASDSPEGVKTGLDKAKEMLSSGEHDPDMEGLEEEMGEDLDHDNEAGEDPEHAEKVLGEKEAPMSEEELDEKIQELLKMKEQLKHRM